mgnify:FL=1
MENEKKSPCARCYKPCSSHELKYDDDYIRELVCYDCRGFHNCETCGKKCDIKRIILDNDNYLVCGMCNKFDWGHCIRCNKSFYTFDLNYVCNGNYACDPCEEIIESGVEEEYTEH